MLTATGFNISQNDDHLKVSTSKLVITRKAYIYIYIDNVKNLLPYLMSGYHVMICVFLCTKEKAYYKWVCLEVIHLFTSVAPLFSDKKKKKKRRNCFHHKFHKFQCLSTSPYATSFPILDFCSFYIQQNVCRDLWPLLPFQIVVQVFFSLSLSHMRAQRHTKGLARLCLACFYFLTPFFHYLFFFCCLCLVMWLCLYVAYHHSSRWWPFFFSFLYAKRLNPKKVVKKFTLKDMNEKAVHLGHIVLIRLLY